MFMSVDWKPNGKLEIASKLANLATNTKYKHLLYYIYNDIYRVS